MKRLFLSLLLAFATLSLYPQAESMVTWIGEEENFVVSLPKTTLYRLPGDPSYYSWRVNYVKETRSAIDYDTYKTKLLKKPQTLLVRGYANRNRQMEYDTYVVEYKDKLYFLPSHYVENNHLLESLNGDMGREYESMTTRYGEAKCELDSLVGHYTKVCEEQCDYYRKLNESLPAIIDSVKNQAKIDYRNLEQLEYDRWYNSLPQSTKRAAQRLSITEARLCSPNTAGGCDYVFTYINNSSKSIKYLYWEGDFYNAVDDLVFCDIRDYCTFRGKDTGPVAPNESGGGLWDCVIYNWSAEYVKLSEVTIIYMDGTSVNIGATDIKRLTTMPSEADFFLQYGSEYDAVKKAARPYEKELVESTGNIRLWEERLIYLQRGNYTYPFTYQNEEYQRVFDRISGLYNESRSLHSKIEKFERNNMLK